MVSQEYSEHRLLTGGDLIRARRLVRDGLVPTMITPTTLPELAQAQRKALVSP